jgi:hypothetical protein
MARAALIGLAAFLLCGCGGGPATPSAPSASNLPQISGTYAGPTTDSTVSPPFQVLLWTIKFARARDNRPSASFRSCTGTLLIQQTGSTFTGTFSQGETCAPTTGVVTGGVVRADGGVTFAVRASAADPLAWTGFAGCTLAIPGTMDFTGTVAGGLLDASFAHDALIECPNDGSVTVNVRLRGAR